MELNKKVLNNVEFADKANLNEDRKNWTSLMRILEDKTNFSEDDCSKWNILKEWDTNLDLSSNHSVKCKPLQLTVDSNVFNIVRDLISQYYRREKDNIKKISQLESDLESTNKELQKSIREDSGRSTQRTNFAEMLIDTYCPDEWVEKTEELIDEMLRCNSVLYENQIHDELIDSTVIYDFQYLYTQMLKFMRNKSNSNE
jgi:uncharacterized membrane protein YgaE (UPF0421/DUF939 family)